MQEKKDTYYIHGSHPEEQERLSKLNVILNEGYLKEMHIQGRERILDVGSGLGQLTRMMARQLGQEGSVLGIERDPDQIATAKRLAEKERDELPVEFRQGNALDLPLSPEEWGSFDIVHTRFVLEHVAQPDRVVAQMVRACKPGGRIILSDDDHSSFKPTPEPAGFSYLWQAYLRSYDRVGNDPYVGSRLVTLLHAHGIQEIRNTLVFFGGCAHQPTFPLVAENLIGIIEGAKALMLKEQLIDPESYDLAIKGLEHWKKLPDAALWYGVYWAEGRRREN